MPAPLAAAQFVAQSGMARPLLIVVAIVIAIILIVVIIWMSKQPQAGTPGGPKPGLVGAALNPFIDITETGYEEVKKIVPKSYTRGVPSKTPSCPSGYTNTGLTCYRAPDSYNSDPKPASCPSGYRNTGTTCYRPPRTIYPASYPWKFGDPAFNYDKAKARCQRAEGRTNCMKKGLIWYAKCPSGYNWTGSSCLRPASSRGYSSMRCPSNRIRKLGMCHLKCKPGYNWTGTTCYRPASTLKGSSMSCPSGWEIWASRCYQKCRPGYHPDGLICYENK